MRTYASEDSSSADFSDECDVLLHATGVLNRFREPNMEDLNTFPGNLVHTARWPEIYQVDTWKSEKGVGIGGGASSTQTVPTMQPHVKHRSICMRTPVWLVEIAGNNGGNTAYTPGKRTECQNDPASLVAHAKAVEDRGNSGWSITIQGSTDPHAAEIVKDREIADRITPDFTVGRPGEMPGYPYLNAIQQPDVKAGFEEAVKMTERRVMGKDGIEVIDVDTIICATRFDTSFRQAFSIVGRNNVDLREKWPGEQRDILG